MTGGYYVEYNGEQWQSVFPVEEAELGTLHSTPLIAADYINSVRPEVDVTIRFGSGPRDWWVSGSTIWGVQR